MPVPFSFGAATSAIPLSQLDSNFNTPITLGNTAIQLGNTVTTLNNMTLANVTISSGNVTITNVTVTTANATTVNTTTLIATTANVTTGNVTNLISGNVTLTGGSITGTPISGSTGSFTTLTTSGTVTLNGGIANGVAYLDGSKVLTTGSALTFDGTTLAVKAGTNQNLRVASGGGVLGLFAINDAVTAPVPLQIQGDDLRFNVASGGSASEQMRLTSTGLGIGTSSPAAPLSFASATGQKIRFFNGVSGYGIGVENSEFRFVTDNSAVFTWGIGTYASPTEAMRLNASGNLGIGTSSPASKLTVSRGGSAGIVSNFTDGLAQGLALTTGTGYFGFYNPNYGAITFRDGGNTTENMRLTDSGNLGLGVTPSAWSTSGWKALEVGVAGNAFTSNAGNSSGITSNAVLTSTGWKYGVNGAANFLAVGNAGGSYAFFTAPSGTAGNAITFTQAMTLDASGNLLVGGTSSAFTSSGRGVVQINGSTESLLGFSQGGTASAYLYSAPSALLIVNAQNTPITFSTNSSERARITSGGNLLVATTINAGSPIVYGGTNTIRNVDSAQGGIETNNNNGNASVSGYAMRYIQNVGSGYHAWETSASLAQGAAISYTECARIDSGGNLGVGRGVGGDTTVGATLYTNGTVTCARSSSNNGDLNLYVYSTGAAAARFYVGMGGTVYATSTTITAISDQRLKENIQDIDVGLDAIMALKPRKFDWKAGKGKDKKGDRGWIAQEFEQVFPDMVDTWADPAPEGEEPYKAVNADLIPVLVKAIQELKAEFDAYKATHP